MPGYGKGKQSLKENERWFSGSRNLGEPIKLPHRMLLRGVRMWDTCVHLRGPITRLVQKRPVGKQMRREMDKNLKTITRVALSVGAKPGRYREELTFNYGTT